MAAERRGRGRLGFEEASAAWGDKKRREWWWMVTGKMEKGRPPAPFGDRQREDASGEEEQRTAPCSLNRSGMAGRKQTGPAQERVGSGQGEIAAAAAAGPKVGCCQV